MKKYLLLCFIAYVLGSSLVLGLVVNMRGIWGGRFASCHKVSQELTVVYLKIPRGGYDFVCRESLLEKGSSGTKINVEIYSGTDLLLSKNDTSFSFHNPEARCLKVVFRRIDHENIPVYLEIKYNGAL